MHLKDQIALIDSQIDLQLPKECDGTTNKWNVKYHGLCREMTIQNDLDEKGKKGLIGLIAEDEEGKFYKVDIEDEYSVQIMHVAINNNPSFIIQWGSFTETNLNYEMKLVCITTRKTMFERVIAGLRNSENTVFRRANYHTESVMRGDMKIVIDQNKNYPPEYLAFTVYYGVTEIEPIIEDENDSDFSYQIGDWRYNTTSGDLVIEKFNGEYWVEKETIT